jgi:hypothetical protein
VNVSVEGRWFVSMLALRPGPALVLYVPQFCGVHVSLSLFPCTCHYPNRSPPLSFISEWDEQANYPEDRRRVSLHDRRYACGIQPQHPVQYHGAPSLTLSWFCRQRCLEFVFRVNIATSITMIIIAQRFERDNLTTVPIATAPCMRVCCCWHAMCR